jgi:hypothetical protein
MKNITITPDLQNMKKEENFIDNRTSQILNIVNSVSEKPCVSQVSSPAQVHLTPVVCRR